MSNGEKTDIQTAAATNVAPEPVSAVDAATAAGTASDRTTLAVMVAIPYLLIGLVVALSKLDPMAMYGMGSLVSFVGHLFGWPLVLLG